MKNLLMLVCVAVLISLPMASMAQSVVEDFEDGLNDYEWTFGNDNDTVIIGGGNPGNWFRNDYLNTFGVRLRSAIGAADFTGNYRMMGVERFSIDARMDLNPYSTYGVPLCILLRRVNDPDDAYDDDYAFFRGDPIPDEGQGWIHYEFEIPSCSTDSIPEGWTGGGADPGFFNPGRSWNDVIVQVDKVEFWFWDVEWYGNYNWFDAGVDNITITYGQPSATENTTWGQVKSLYK